ncbi:MAG: hypothetical protein U5J64_12685 [Halobacteriales archaeon]|nr:hypothetical protein [Halobacteriales archaeon]
MRQSLATNEKLRRVFLFVGAVLLFVFVVATEPQTVADMAVVTVGVLMVLVGLYLSRRAETTAVEKAELERKTLEAEPDVVPEDAELPRRNPFDGQG